MPLKHDVIRGLNALLRPLDATVLRRSEIEPFLAERETLSRPSHAVSTLPEGAEAYLRPDHPRLQELIAGYRATPHAATRHSMWTRDLVEAHLDLRHFRGDNVYVWQHRGLNSRREFALSMLATAYYVKGMDRLGLLARFREDGLFGAYTLEADAGRLVSRDLLDSAIELHFLERHLGLSQRQGLRMLDIGGGYGRFAHRAVEAFSGLERMLVTDGVAESTFLSEYYLRFRGLGDRARVVPLPEIESALAGEKIDVVTNIHSFSECSLETITWWFDLVRSREVPHVLVIPNAGSDGGRTLVSRESDDRRRDFQGVLEARGYRRVACEPKFSDPGMQEYGIFPTHYHLFHLEG